ncbi:MAG: phosphoribosylformylglycinamidine synthase subunit PurS [Firmicutes bacterium HGW-Firmicutes-12]|jgi:phosphoribosylformylglycinamidine synthase|nr:MAG: phosphoribosylformylglycinamidine synthase subunit PurS [Firmicutes bacterium HGW-Firmicutes-12]
MFKAVISVNFKKSILDPQGNAVLKALNSLGYQNVEDVRIGKHIEVMLDCENKDKAKEQLNEMCDKLLANPVIEDYQVEVVEVGR